ncbi:MAG: GNAT family N-acetyltransferase [Treponema sp.]|nr:GNAT family N-acetyltransferase [Treponema sp.]
MKKNILIENLNYSEVGNLMVLLKTLAEHHNKTSLHFSGFYPLKSFEQAISEMSQKIKDGYAMVDVIRVDGQIIAFSQYSVEQNIGKLEFLAVLPEYRNNGYGGLLMEKALKYFETKPIKRIELRVAYGNDNAKRFYEQYGFRILSQNMAIIH